MTIVLVALGVPIVLPRRRFGQSDGKALVRLERSAARYADGDGLLDFASGEADRAPAAGHGPGPHWRPGRVSRTRHREGEGRGAAVASRMAE